MLGRALGGRTRARSPQAYRFRLRHRPSCRASAPRSTSHLEGKSNVPWNCIVSFARFLLSRMGELGCRTWNKASYNFTTFCWNISGRACWVKGEASIVIIWEDTGDGRVQNGHGTDGIGSVETAWSFCHHHALC